MKKMVAVLLGFVLLGGQGKAHADVIVATFTGQVTSVTDPANGQFTNGIQPGATFSATVTYDANASPHTNGADSADYAFLSVSLHIGNRVFDLDGSDPTLGRYTITVDNNRFGNDGLSVVGTLHPALYAPGSHFQIDLRDPTQSVFSSLALPTSLDLQQFGGHGDFFMALKPAAVDGSVGFAQVWGSVNSVTLRDPTAQAPEPSALVLLATAGVGVLGIARRRRPWSGTAENS